MEERIPQFYSASPLKKWLVHDNSIVILLNLVVVILSLSLSMLSFIHLQSEFAFSIVKALQLLTFSAVGVGYLAFVKRHLSWSFVINKEKLWRNVFLLCLLIGASLFIVYYIADKWMPLLALGSISAFLLPFILVQTWQSFEALTEGNGERKHIKAGENSLIDKDQVELKNREWRKKEEEELHQLELQLAEQQTKIAQQNKRLQLQLEAEAKEAEAREKARKLEIEKERLQAEQIRLQNAEELYQLQLKQEAEKQKMEAEEKEHITLKKEAEARKKARENAILENERQQEIKQVKGKEEQHQQEAEVSQQVIDKIKSKLPVPEPTGKKDNVWFYTEIKEWQPVVFLNSVPLYIKLLVKSDSTEEELFKISAPLDMRLGDFFDLFINQKRRNENLLIDLTNEEQKPIGWSFYTTGITRLTKRELDPELSLQKNKIKELAIIMAKRAK